MTRSGAIVASPCAVVLATMPPLLAAMANAGRHGVLVKSAVAMEQAAGTGIVAFDKTGTLTEGTPRLAAIRPLPGARRGEREILALAAAENPSEHPLARAVVTAARDAGLLIQPAAGFTALPGRGIAATVSGHRPEIGSPAHLPAAAEGAVSAEVAALEEGGQTAAVMLIDDAPAALLGIADRIRPEAAAAIARITAVTGTAPVLLTGDNQRAAARLAAQAGITDVRAGLLPEDKVRAVRELEERGRSVLLAGDGVNDAPAMAGATTGAAMGRADTDLALDTADLALARGDLTDAQWARLEPRLPMGKKPGRPSAWTRRQLIDGVRFRTRTDVPWRDVPERYGPWARVYDLFRRWQRDGTWQRIFAQLQARADARELITWDINVDSTVCRAHQHAAGARKRGSCRSSRPAVSAQSRTTMTLAARAVA